MILAFAMLAVGGILLGGAWSFFRQHKSLWTTILLAVLGVLAVGIAFWRIQQG